MLMDDWIKDVKKKGGVDTDGAYGKQCMDLYNDYCHRVLGISGKTGASCAKLILKNTYVMKYFKKIKNYLEFIPQKGDIVVWTSGDYGHVAIVRDNKSTINVLRTIDQNWVSQKLTEENHNYTYMAPLYFLRPLDQSNINPKKEEVKEEVKVEETKLEVPAEEPKVETSAEEKTEIVETKPVTDNTIAEEETNSIENTVNTSENQSSHKNILMKILELLKQLINLLFK